MDILGEGGINEEDRMKRQRGQAPSTEERRRAKPRGEQVSLIGDMNKSAGVLRGYAPMAAGPGFAWPEEGRQGAPPDLGRLLEEGKRSGSPLQRARGGKRSLPSNYPARANLLLGGLFLFLFFLFLLLFLLEFRADELEHGHFGPVS